MSNTDSSTALPGVEYGRVERPKLYTITIGVTGRCNAACSYCHYYRANNRKDVAYDISDELFDTYIDFVARWLDTIPGRITYRFSGGEPLVLGDRLFSLADRAYARTSLKPFVLSSGKALSEAWDGTNYALFSNDDPSATLIARRQAEHVEKLNIGTLVSTECGHGFRAFGTGKLGNLARPGKRGAENAAAQAVENAGLDARDDLGGNLIEAKRSAEAREVAGRVGEQGRQPLGRHHAGVADPPYAAEARQLRC